MSLRRNAEGMATPDDFTVIEDDILNRAADMDAVRLSEGEWVGFDAYLSEVLIDGEPPVDQLQADRQAYDRRVMASTL